MEKLEEIQEQLRQSKQQTCLQKGESMRKKPENNITLIMFGISGGKQIFCQAFKTLLLHSEYQIRFHPKLNHMLSESV